MATPDAPLTTTAAAANSTPSTTNTGGVELATGTVHPAPTTPGTVAAAAAPKGEQAQQGEGEGIVLHHLDDSRSQRILWLLEVQMPYPFLLTA
jgi:hypothetical protein